MRIGIGVTTCDRPEMLDECLENIQRFSNIFFSQKLYVYDDSGKYNGVAYGKNKCLAALQDCDHIFLFDDDCYPIKEGWEYFFISSGEPHLLFLNYNHNYYQTIGKVRYYKDCGGVFMYMTKETVDRAGLFNEEYGRWGFEHAEYSCKILGGHGKYPMLAGTSEYLYSEDYSNPLHKSVLKKEEKEYWFKKNINIFAKNVKL